MGRHYQSARLNAVVMAATMLLMILLLPATMLLPRLASHMRGLRDDEDGEIVQNILWVAGFAAIAIAVIAIVRTFVLSEAENLPTSGDIGN